MHDDENDETPIDPMADVPPGWTGPIFDGPDGFKTIFDPSWDYDSPDLTPQELRDLYERMKTFRKRNRIRRRAETIDSLDGVARRCPALAAKRVGRVMTRAFDRVMRGLDKKLWRLGMKRIRSTQFIVLALVWGNASRRWNITALAAELSVDRSTLSRSLKRLARRKMVEFERGKDARSRIVRLTKRGREVTIAAKTRWSGACGILVWRLGNFRVFEDVRMRCDAISDVLLRGLKLPIPAMIRDRPPS